MRRDSLLRFLPESLLAESIVTVYVPPKIKTKYQQTVFLAHGMLQLKQFHFQFFSAAQARCHLSLILLKNYAKAPNLRKPALISEAPWR